MADGQTVADTATLSSIKSSVLFMCYPEMQFHVHQQQGPIRSITLSSFASVEKLRSEVAVGSLCLDCDVKKICNEDPNLLILESNDSVLTEDDSLPLYQTSFSERNILRVTFMVGLLPFP